MKRSNKPGPDGLGAAYEDEAPADEAATRAFLLQRQIRDFTPLSKSFVQNPNRKSANRAAPLSDFVRRGDLRGLKALLFVHAITSSTDDAGGWSTTLPLTVWARVFDTTKTAVRPSASSAATKILSRLEDRKLITRRRSGRARTITVTLLRPDSSGAPYIRPDGKTDRFLKLSHRYWTEGWHDKLELPATAMLLVALHEKPVFELATERVPEWYGWSSDTAERGMKALAQSGLIKIHKRVKAAPLSPTGATEVNVYTLTSSLVSLSAVQDTSKKAKKSTQKSTPASGLTKMRVNAPTKLVRRSDVSQ